MTFDDLSTKEQLAEIYAPVAGKTAKTKRPSKKAQDAAIDRARLMIMAGKHVPAAIQTIRDLMAKGYREATRLKAATTLIEISVGDPTSAATEQTKVYVLSVDPQAAAAEARRRLGK